MSSYDVARKVWHIARHHVIQHTLDPRFVSQMSSYDVASGSHWTLVS